MCSGVTKSGSPSSRWMTVRPVASRACARVCTVEADSVPSRASTALASALDARETLEALARLAVEMFADICAIDILEDRWIRRVAVVHREPAKQEIADRMREFAPSLEADTVIPRVMRTA